MEKWFHKACFFSKNRPKTTGDIAHFDSIRWEDQNFVKEQIGIVLNFVVITDLALIY